LVFCSDVNGQNSIQWPVAQLQSGVYYLRLIGTSGTWVKQVVKE
jgi:hypothetical protein